MRMHGCAGPAHAPSCARWVALRTAHANVPMALAAGDYTWSVNGSNECPAPSLRIVDAAACQSAAAAAGKTFDGTVVDPTFPRGCAWYTTGFYVHLNTAVGAGSPSAVLLCALGTVAPTGSPITGAPTTGVPPSRRAYVRACEHLQARTRTRCARAHAHTRTHTHTHTLTLTHAPAHTPTRAHALSLHTSTQTLSQALSQAHAYACSHA
jgi:hypothetical protein